LLEIIIYTSLQDFCRMSYCHNSRVRNIFLKHWKNHYLKVVKIHPGPETRLSFLFERSGDRTRTASGPRKNCDRISIGIEPVQDQDQGRGRIEIESGPGWKCDRTRTRLGAESGLESFLGQERNWKRLIPRISRFKTLT
jgi:hypothetical protein